MVVLILESVPPGLRGELSKWMLEPKAGVFVGTVSGAVRDLLWEKACAEVGEGGCTMLHSSANEQGFAIRSFGDTTRLVEEWEGLFLVRRPSLAAKPEPSDEHLPAPSDWEQYLYPEIWAKSPDRAPTGTVEKTYHPLICHMIDTAMVALCLWENVLSPALKEELRGRLGLATRRVAGRWVAFFAGSHDLGKATPAFARKWDSGWRVLRNKGYRNARSDESKPHGVLSAHLLERLLPEVGVPEPMARQVAEVAGGHHGLFPSAFDRQDGSRFIGEGPWVEARLNLVRLLAHLLGVDRAPKPQGHLEEANASLMILAGLTSVADWIASDSALFPFAGNVVRLPHYLRLARRRARDGLKKLGWFSQPSALAPRSFPDLFDKVPNKLQEQVIDLAPQLVGPSLVLLEYPMGGGKTEAALYLADHLAAAAGERGAYFALPTMATSNQMFGRVNTYLANRFPDTAINVQLLHGHAALNAEFEVLKRAGGELARPSHLFGAKGSGLLAAEWFTYRKRGLLAPYGIGTIDQALLGVLQTKHFFVRLFGLAGKVVILDEVHAYDTYMQTLLTRLLTWLAACGTSVILLSATLPASTRQALLTAYAAGRGQQAAPGDPAAVYPRLSWVTAEGADACHVEGATDRRLGIRQFNQKDDTWIPALREALADGGCAAVVLNTVTRAQQVFRKLQAHFPPGELSLFHARYPFDARAERERMILERFGPETDERPHRAVVVATQVIEQSLDLDFDLMVTDLAPVDLLLQRSGRVQRHAPRVRPPGLAAPTLLVLSPELDDEGRPAFEEGSAKVYDPHTLLRTWLALRGRDEVAIPDGVEELVEAVYREEPAPEDLSEPLRTSWSRTWEKLAEGREVDKQKARKRYIPDVSDDFFGMGLADLDDDDDTLHQAHQAMTRLGGPSVTVVCLTAEGDRLWASGDERREIRLERRPDQSDVRALLGCSVRISFDPGLVKRILASAPPLSWESSAHLRRCRLLLFAQDGTCLTEGVRLRLDPQLGLVDERVREEEER
jgi:CRISPR-associated endonuclease/helicase Cas3